MDFFAKLFLKFHFGQGIKMSILRFPKKVCKKTRQTLLRALCFKMKKLQKNHVGILW